MGFPAGGRNERGGGMLAERMLEKYGAAGSRKTHIVKTRLPCLERIAMLKAEVLLNLILW